jgi:hypothetical protein
MSHAALLINQRTESTSRVDSGPKRQETAPPSENWENHAHAGDWITCFVAIGCILLVALLHAWDFVLGVFRFLF